MAVGVSHRRVDAHEFHRRLERESLLRRTTFLGQEAASDTQSRQLRTTTTGRRVVQLDMVVLQFHRARTAHSAKGGASPGREFAACCRRSTCGMHDARGVLKLTRYRATLVAFDAVAENSESSPAFNSRRLSGARTVMSTRPAPSITSTTATTSRSGAPPAGLRTCPVTRNAAGVARYVSDRSSTRGAVWTGDGTDTVVAEATASDAGAALVAAAELRIGAGEPPVRSDDDGECDADRGQSGRASRRRARWLGFAEERFRCDGRLARKFVDSEQSVRIGRRIGDRICGHAARKRHLRQQRRAGDLTAAILSNDVPPRAGSSPRPVRETSIPRQRFQIPCHYLNLKSTPTSTMTSTGAPRRVAGAKRH